jgi:DNA invertase Pin-like site-specific DNA recombinase
MVELGYARVSTTEQDLTRQLDALDEVGIADRYIWVDKKTGATVARPGLYGLLDYARPGDVVVSHRLDRLGRNLREVLGLVHDLRERGIGVRTLADPLPIDTSDDDSPIAQISVAMLALFAEMQRIWTNESAAHARDVRRKNGRPAGPPPKLTGDTLAAAQASLDSGMRPEQVAKTFGVSRATVYRRLRVPAGGVAGGPLADPPDRDYRNRSS